MQQSRVRELNELHQTVEHMGRTIEAFLRLSQQMASEPGTEHLLQQVLEQLVQPTDCDGAQVCLWDAHAQQMHQAAHPHPPRSLPTEREQLALELHGHDGRLESLLLEFPTHDAHSTPRP